MVFCSIAGLYQRVVSGRLLLARKRPLGYNRAHYQEGQTAELVTAQDYTRIRANIERVRERIERACGRCGRLPDEVTLIAVSKTVAPELVELAVRAGAGDLGENYVQEAQTKIETLGRAARWHMIGHLQTNKASRAALLFDMVQSVDSPRLARKLSDAAEAAGKRLEVLIEVNISGEEAKTGVAKCEALSLAAEAAALPGLALKGLMAIPPFLDDPDQVRPYFRELREMFEMLPEERRQVLSMGMSGDFEAAIEEGATMVRVGTAIFGSRLAA